VESGVYYHKNCATPLSVRSAIINHQIAILLSHPTTTNLAHHSRSACDFYGWQTVIEQLIYAAAGHEERRWILRGRGRDCNEFTVFALPLARDKRYFFPEGLETSSRENHKFKKIDEILGGDRRTSCFSCNSKNFSKSQKFFTLPGIAISKIRSFSNRLKILENRENIIGK